LLRNIMGPPSVAVQPPYMPPPGKLHVPEYITAKHSG